MKGRRSSRSELDETISRLLDGELGRRERAQLQTLFKSDPKACERYLDLCELSVGLEFIHAGSESTSDEIESRHLSLASSTDPSRSKSDRKRRLFAVIATAAAILLAVGLFKRFKQPDSLGKIVSQFESELLLENAAFTSSFLGDGRYELKRGVVRYQTPNQSEVVVEGPAEFKLESVDRLELFAGRVTVKMNAGQSGFEVRTPSILVVDLGTEFGVEVMEDATEVHVFEGSVAVSSNSANRVNRTVVDGEAVRYLESRDRLQSIENSPRFLRPSQEITAEKLYVYPRLVNSWRPLANYRMRPADDAFRCDQSRFDGSLLGGGQGSQAGWVPGLIGAGMRLGNEVEMGGAKLERGLPLPAKKWSMVAWGWAEKIPESMHLMKFADRFLGSFDSDGRFVVQADDERWVTSATLQVGSWHQLALTYDGNQLRVFWDGELSKRIDSRLPNLNGVEILVGTDGQDSVWQGILDEVSFFNSVLTAEVIRESHDRCLREDLPRAKRTREAAKMESDGRSSPRGDSPEAA